MATPTKKTGIGRATKKATPTPTAHKPAPRRLARPLQSLHNLVRQSYALKVEAEHATEEYDGSKQELLGAFDSAGEYTVDVSLGGKTIKATKVGGETTTVDEDKLRTLLGDEVVDRACKKVLDNKLLEALIITGDIDAKAVAKATTIKPKNPHVRFTLEG